MEYTYKYCILPKIRNNFPTLIHNYLEYLCRKKHMNTVFDISTENWSNMLVTIDKTATVDRVRKIKKYVEKCNEKELFDYSKGKLIDMCKQLHMKYLKSIIISEDGNIKNLTFHSDHITCQASLTKGLIYNVTVVFDEKQKMVEDIGYYLLPDGVYLTVFNGYIHECYTSALYKYIANLKKLKKAPENIHSEMKLCAMIDVIYGQIRQKEKHNEEKLTIQNITNCIQNLKEYEIINIDGILNRNGQIYMVTRSDVEKNLFNLEQIDDLIRSKKE